MPFTVKDFQDLLRILDEQPEWRAELRQRILTQEMLGLPRAVEALLAAQRQVEAQIAALVEAQQRVEDQIAALAEAQRQTEERLARLEATVQALAEAQQRAEERLAGLEERVARVETQIAALFEALQRVDAQIAALVEAQQRAERGTDVLERDIGMLKGYILQQQYRERPYVYFRQIVRRARTLSGDELDDLLEGAVKAGKLSEREADDIIASDVVVQGRLREDGRKVYLLVEVSWGIGAGDVERAARRAALLERTGESAVPVVAGSWLTPEGEEKARELGVWVVQDGHALSPEDLRARASQS